MPGAAYAPFSNETIPIQQCRNAINSLLTTLSASYCASVIRFLISAATPHIRWFLFLFSYFSHQKF